MPHAHPSPSRFPASLPIVSNGRESAGFTLIELAIVLLILSLVMGGGLTYLTGRAVQVKYEVTEKRLDRVEEALWQYRRANGRLPCPADRTLAPGALNYGKGGSGSGGTCPTYNYASTANSLGAVPTRTLNLPDSYMLDGWDRKLTYIVSNNLTQASAFTTVPITDVPGGNIQIVDGGGINKTTPYGAAFVLVSHGRNGFCAYGKYGTLTATPLNTSTDEMRNGKCLDSGAADSAPDDIFVQKEQNLNTASSYSNYFDDIVRYKTRFQLYAGTTTPETPPITSFPLNP